MRKKAQCQNRKAKQVAEAQINHDNAAAASCDHLGQQITNLSQDDRDGILNLDKEFISGFNKIILGVWRGRFLK